MSKPDSMFCSAVLLILAFVISIIPSNADAAVYDAGPSNYTSYLSSLQPGDTLNLAAGTYANDLYVSGLNGTTGAWITIQGPASGSPAHFNANASSNTVEIVNCSFLAIKNLTLDGLNQSGPFGVSASNGASNLVHDILIENCIIQNYNGSQQTDGISTKTPTWNWTIRGNQIINAGTGLYLGNSDGSDPFIAGVIENNLVEYPIGYCMEIKPQNAWPAVAGLPTGTTTTIVRNNVFIKNDAASPDGDRPNLLIDTFPASGAGSGNRYEVYGNLFYHNPRESLFQFSGRVTVHDNVFVDTPNNAVVAQNHPWTDTSGTVQTSTVMLAHVYNNTIYSVGNGIYFSSAATQGDDVTGNLVFATNPIGGSIANQSNNIVDSAANAANYVAAPSTTLGSMNFYPRAGQCAGSALSISLFTSDTDYSIDFNGASKGSFTYRGAYSGSGVNPGWQLQAGIKPAGVSPIAPSITAQPANVTVTAGQTASFSVGASGTAPFTYQWQKNNSNISGATSASYTTPATATTDGGSTFRCVVSNSVGSATSNAATLTVNAAAVAPSITTQPANVTVTAGQTASFSVGASGTAPFTYQWQKNNLNISGATSASYTTSATAAADSGSTFRCVVTNSAGSATSNSATLTVKAVNTPPVITSAAFASPNPGAAGQSVALTVAASDSDADALTYAWTFGDGGSGAGSSTSHIFAAAGTYTATATVSDGNGNSVSSAVTVTVSAAPPPPPPAINSALTASGTVGAAFTYTITATNNPTGFNATGLPAGLSVNTATGVISGAPSADGTSSVALSATNAGGTGTATLTLTVAAAPKTLHVAAIAMSLSTTSTGKAGSATVTIKDGNGAAVSGATVAGTWSGLTSASATKNTGTAGTVKFTSARSKKTGTFTFTVTNVAKSGYAYASNQNAATSGSITTTGAITLASAPTAAAPAGTPVAAPDAVSLGSVKANQTFKVALPRPGDIPQTGSVRSTAGKLPAGVRTTGGFIGGKAKAAGAYTFTVHFQARTTVLDDNGKSVAATVETDGEYTLTVTP